MFQKNREEIGYLKKFKKRVQEKKDQKELTKKFTKCPELKVQGKVLREVKRKVLHFRKNKFVSFSINYIN